LCDRLAVNGIVHALRPAFCGVHTAVSRHVGVLRNVHFVLFMHGDSWMRTF